MRDINAAICDDEAMALDMVGGALKACFARYGATLHLDAFSSSAILENCFLEKHYQLVFLDIDMPQIDGIALGIKIKKESEDTTIIYISNCEERVFDSFAARPFGFVRKSSILKDIESVTKSYLASLKDEGKSQNLEIKTAEGLMRLKIDEVVYIECSRDYQFFHLKNVNDPLKSRLRMNILENLLKDSGFLRAHQGFLVNYRYIRRIGNDTIELTTGEKIPMSRRKKQDLVLNFMRLTRQDESVFANATDPSESH